VSALASDSLSLGPVGAAREALDEELLEVSARVENSNDAHDPVAYPEDDPVRNTDELSSRAARFGFRDRS
jgi:hypothetical protein